MNDRRAFIKALISSAIATTLLPNIANAEQTNLTNTALPMKPKRLKAGHTIGLITPSSNTWEDQEIHFAIDVLKSFGFKVKQGKYIFQRRGYLAGNDKDRAWDINNMFQDKDVDGIFCLRGGYGSPRILPYLDYDLIAANPKALIGYSDITALLNAIYAKTGLITFHGPIAKQNFSEYTLQGFKDVLFTPQANIDLGTPPLFEAKEGQAEKKNRLTLVTKGVAKGRLIGGNLSLMVKLVGTPFEPDYSDKILFLEDVEEAPYRVDGMLTHLKIAGRLNKLAGIVFGKCTDCTASGDSLSIEEVIKDRLGDLNIPVLKGVMIGHISDMSTIPVGAMATLDATNKRLVLNEAAVS
ncbi:LD-carboxypeptidase [Paraglaciecola aquimarina]|uniref:LD-carboxypeptidase n=1 Tax=Paraglaciecola algarum TaxID=3050085 RepID=A0ABS9D716_9ALTE|nr:LD-carboxypeptidase [Paraglaciecola sp. G1-23]MCF2947812.1 LD-carboxypeptidase [Paraglaciecola sp. G1-23]